MAAYSREETKEFTIQRLHLTPEAQGRTRDDVPSIIRDIGGLQYGGHKVELFNRFEDFRPEWLDYWCKNHTLLEGHVLRGALRVICAEEYPYYFKATRSVSRRRQSYHKCPASLTPEHLKVLSLIERHGPLTPSEFKVFLDKGQSRRKAEANRLLYDLYNYGKVARIGRKNSRPLYHCTKSLPFELDMESVSEEAAKQWLFLKCLSIYGPFTIHDIAHWVGWTLTETKQIAEILLKEYKIAGSKIEDESEPHYLRTEDLSFMDSLNENLPEHSFVKILFNDDALLLGCYRRLESFFGYRWRYPQLSEGIVWRAALLYGRELIGEAVVDMYAKDRTFNVRGFFLRKDFSDKEIIDKIAREFRRHAVFQGKTLQMREAQLVS